jgi:hypothetical protein
MSSRTPSLTGRVLFLQGKVKRIVKAILKKVDSEAPFFSAIIGLEITNEVRDWAWSLINGSLINIELSGRRRIYIS